MKDEDSLSCFRRSITPPSKLVTFLSKVITFLPNFKRTRVSKWRRFLHPHSDTSTREGRTSHLIHLIRCWLAPAITTYLIELGRRWELAVRCFHAYRYFLGGSGHICNLLYLIFCQWAQWRWSNISLEKYIQKVINKLVNKQRWISAFNMWMINLCWFIIMCNID